jgi:putative ABC transport system substrate-binding protein
MTTHKKSLLKLRVSAIIILFFCAGIFFSGCTEKDKVYRVGIICDVESFADIADGFKAKMGELGYIEGKDIIYDFRKSGLDPAAQQKIINKFIEDKVDLIFAFPTEAAMAAKALTRGKNIPVVFAMAGIEGNDLVESLLRPGANITGVRFPNKESTAKRLEFLRELAPSAKRVYIIYDPDFPNAPFAVETLRKVAVPLGIDFVEDLVKNMEEYKLALHRRSLMKDAGIDAIFLMPDFLNASFEGLAAVMQFANIRNLPVAGGVDSSADGGAMFSYVPGNPEQGRLAAFLADKIFRGTPAGTIPVVTPESRLRINYKAIRQLGLSVSENLLNRADEIIR